MSVPYKCEKVLFLSYIAGNLTKCDILLNSMRRALDARRRSLRDAQVNLIEGTRYEIRSSDMGKKINRHLQHNT